MDLNYKCIVVINAIIKLEMEIGDLSCPVDKPLSSTQTHKKFRFP